MTFHEAMSGDARAFSDAQLDEALSVLGERKRHLRFTINWQPIMAAMEMSAVMVTTRDGESKSLVKCRIPVNDEHRRLCEQARPINRRIADLVDGEMFQRQGGRARARSKTPRAA